MGGNFKFQVQDSDLEYIFLEIWKTHRTFWKKATFSTSYQKIGDLFSPVLFLDFSPSVTIVVHTKWAVSID